MIRRFFRVIAVFFTPRRASRRLYQYEAAIANTTQDIESSETASFERFERALASRIAGTYKQAYAEGHRDGVARGAADAIRQYRAFLNERGLKAPQIGEQV